MTALQWAVIRINENKTSRRIHPKLAKFYFHIRNKGNIVIIEDDLSWPATGRLLWPARSIPAL